MATLIDNKDGTVMMTLTVIEQSTLDANTLEALTQYVTLWLEERTKMSFSEKFSRLTPQDQADVLAKFTGK